MKSKRVMYVLLEIFCITVKSFKIWTKWYLLRVTTIVHCLIGSFQINFFYDESEELGNITVAKCILNGKSPILFFFNSVFQSRIRIRNHLVSRIRILPFFTPNYETYSKNVVKSEQIHHDYKHITWKI